MKKILNFRLSFCILIFAFCILLSGCDAFVRKFTRKPKKENLPKEEMVLAPQEYKGPQMSKENLYRQYFLFWRAWHDELVNGLTQKVSQKRQIYCAQEVIENLINLKPLLNEEKQKKMDIYISQLKELKELITQDIYSSNATRLAQSAERIKRGILRDFK